MHGSQKWFYSYPDADAGFSIGRVDDHNERINLIIRGQPVIRPHSDIWRRHAFENIAVKEKALDSFYYHLAHNTVSGAKYTTIHGYVLWRYWYRILPTRSGGWQKQRVCQDELVAAVLDDSVVYRSEGALTTERMIHEFPLAFKGDIVPITEIIEKHDV